MKLFSLLLALAWAAAAAERPGLQIVNGTATKAGLWKAAYASTNHHEYFAEGVQSWFDNNRESENEHNHVNTRAELEVYDSLASNVVS